MKKTLRILRDEKRNRRCHHEKMRPEEANNLAIVEHVQLSRQPVLRCICCEKRLFAVYELAEYQPSDGVHCHTHGNYGSTLFDPSYGNETLHFMVCDDCLLKKSQHMFVFQKDNEEVISFKEYLRVELEIY